MPRRSGLRRRIQVVLILLFGSALSLSAVEGNFQINTVFQRTSYPLFGSGGKDIVRHSSAGIGLKSTRGSGFQGVIDLAVLFPYKLEEKIYPAADFSDRSITGFPIVLDAVLGFGYMFDLSPMVFLVSTGFHTGSLFEGGDSLVAFGLALDAQTFVRLGKIITAQIGFKFAVDFWGTQNFVPGSNELAGFPLTFGLYTGIGLNY
jgi:hypothetical protein